MAVPVGGLAVVKELYEVEGIIQGVYLSPVTLNGSRLRHVFVLESVTRADTKNGEELVAGCAYGDEEWEPTQSRS